MVTSSDISHQAPPSDGDLLEAIEGRWTLHILLCLKEGAHRFSDLKAAIPRISSNVLTERMRTLEGAGLVERQYLPPPSASHVYQLAAAAEGLKPALDALASWQAEGIGAGDRAPSMSFHSPP